MAAKNFSDEQEVRFYCPEMEKVWKSLKEVAPYEINLSDCPIVRYDVTEFWRNIRFASCDIVDGKLIRQAFRDLCRLLSLSTQACPKALNLACLLAAQLRSPVDHQSLLVDQEKCRSTFCAKDPHSIEKCLVTADDETNFGEPRVYFQDFLSSVNEMSEEEATIFGPVFASVIVSLKKCGGRTAANKIFYAKNNLTKCYPKLRAITVRLPAKQVLTDILDRHKEAYAEDYSRNAVILGCMYAYHKQDVSVEMKEMLDELVLKSFRYASMQLLTFVDEVTKVYGCSVDEYRRLTDDYYQGKYSWIAYDRFVAEYGADGKLAEGDAFWMYAREFSHGVFQQLKYNNNMWLCNFSADLLDLKLRADRVKAWPVLGPTYQSLTKYKRSKSVRSYCETHHQWARDVHDVLNDRHPSLPDLS